MNVLLTEMERHRGIVFLATNRPYDLDEAMHRRITLVVEFTPPDHLLRVDIWKSLLPPKLPLAEGIDLKKIALKYEVRKQFPFGLISEPSGEDSCSLSLILAPFGVPTFSLSLWASALKGRIHFGFRMKTFSFARHRELW